MMNKELSQFEGVIDSAPNAIERIKALNALAESLGNSDYDQILRLSSESEKLARREGYTVGLVAALRYQAHVYHRLGNYADTLRVAHEALRICEEMTVPDHQGVLLAITGFTYSDLGDYPKALEYQHKGLAIYETQHDIPSQMRALVNIGIVNSMAGNPKQAIEYYERSIKLSSASDSSTLGRAYNSSCVDYITLGDFEKATFYGEKALEIFTEIHDVYGVGVAHSTLGEVALAAQDFPLAIQKFERACDVFRSSNGNLTSQEAIETRLNLAQAHLSIGNHEVALRHAADVLQTANDQHMQRFAMRCHHLLSCIYEQEHKADLALQHLKTYIEIREKTLSESSQRQINNLEIIYETREAQAAIERHKKLREQDRQNYERMTQIKNDFLHSATHDIKNPLSSIMMSSYLLTQTIPTENAKAHEYIRRLNESGQKIRHLVEDILDLARLETMPSIYMETVTLSPWFESLITSFKTLAEAKQITLHSEVKPPDLICKCNKERMSQALENLISNAIKYTPEGGEVSLSAVHKGTQTQIEVSDTGIGIPKDALPHIFERFYRVDKRSTNVEGTGLGLSIVKLCVEQNGGVIQVKSKPTRGSIFTITLNDESQN